MRRSVGFAFSGLATGVALVLAIQVATARVPASIAVRGKAVSAVAVIADENLGGSTTTNGGDSSWVDVPTGTTSVTIPSTWTKGLLTFTFSGDSRCYGVAHNCAFRIMVGNATAGPMAEQFDLAVGFDSTTGTEPYGTDVATFEAHAMQRAITVGPGTYTVKVQWAALDSATCSGCSAGFDLRNWQLTVLRSRVS